MSSGARVPVQILTAYRNGINRGFDSVTNGISLIQQVLSGIGGSANTDTNRIDDTRYRRQYQRF